MHGKEWYHNYGLAKGICTCIYVGAHRSDHTFQTVRDHVKALLVQSANTYKGTMPQHMYTMTDNC